MRTDPGELRHLATYQRPVVTKDSLGQARQGWEDVFTAYVAVRPLSAREIYYAQSTRSETTHRIALRWRPEVNSKGRFLYGDRVFNIYSVLNVDELNSEIVCMAVGAN